jgi:hypothetical protein
MTVAARYCTLLGIVVPANSKTVLGFAHFLCASNRISAFGLSASSDDHGLKIGGTRICKVYDLRNTKAAVSGQALERSPLRLVARLLYAR